MDTPELRAELLRLMRSGCTLTEICARDDMPPIATYFMWKQKDPEFARQVELAMSDHAEALISDAMEQNVAAIDALEEAEQNAASGTEPVNSTLKDAPARAKAADLYLQASLKYAGAIAPARYGSLVKLADAQIGNGIQISITSYANDGRAHSDSGTENPNS